MDHQVPEAYGGRVDHLLLNREIWVNPKVGSQVDGKLALIRDIPDYLAFESKRPVGTRTIRIPQYRGYLVDLRGYPHIDDFLRAQLSRRNIKNLHSKQRGLEKLGKVEYRTLSGPLGEERYARAFETFYSLLKKRFDSKKIWNRDLAQWEDLYRQALPRLLGNQAVLFQIVLEGRPICMALDYIMENSAFSHIQTYDMAFSKYNLGDINMLFQLQWCLDHGISIFDMSKGKNPYKEKWCNHSYRFHHEISYGPGRGQWRAKWTALGYTGIQKLRELGILGNLVHVDKWLYRLRKNRLRNEIHLKSAPYDSHAR